MPQNTPNNKRIAKNTIFLYLRMIFVLLVSLYTSRVLLQALGVIDYGVYNVVAGFVSMFAFINTSIANGIQRFYNYSIGTQTENGIQKIYVTAIIIQIIIAGIIVILLETIGLWYINYKMNIPPERTIAAHWVFQCTVISTIVLMMQIPFSASVMAYEKMNYYAIVGVVDVILKLLIAFILPYFPIDRLQLYGLLLMLVSIIDFVLYFSYAKLKFEELKFKLFFDKGLFFSMLGFTSWNIFGTFAFMIKGQGLNVLLNFFFGPVVNAARGIASQVMYGLQGFSANILTAFRPQLIQAYAGKDYDRVKTLFWSESKISYLMLLLISTPIIIDVEYILNLWLGEGMVPDYTKSFTILILANSLISAFHQPLTHIVHATGQQKTFQLVNAFVICSILPVSWVFLKLGYDPNSVFIVSLVLTAINIGICMLVVRKLFDFGIKSYIYKVIFPCLLTSLVLPLIPICIEMTMQPGFLRLMIIVLTELVFGVPIIYLCALNKEEKQYIKNILSKFIKI